MNHMNHMIYEPFVLLTNKSRLPTRMYLSIKSRIVSQQAVKVGEVNKSFKCCKNTFERSEAALILVSSIEFGSCGEILSERKIFQMRINF